MTASIANPRPRIAVVEAHLLPATTLALDELVWWARATVAARGVEPPQA